MHNNLVDTSCLFGLHFLDLCVHSQKSVCTAALPVTLALYI